MSEFDRHPERENPEILKSGSEEEGLPAPLRSDLRALFGESEPAEELTAAEQSIHDRLLTEVRNSSPKSTRFAGARGGLVAASLLCALSAALYLKSENESVGTLDSATNVAIDAGENSPLDRDRDGKVDIRDAFLLARQIRDESAPEDADLDANGRIDRRDFELIARASVRLSGE